MTRNRPSIHTIGGITDDGTTVRIHGWSLGQCSPPCPCHRHPRTGRLYINTHIDGLGLLRFKTCSCCNAWTVDELADVLRDLADVGAMETA